MDPSPLNPRSRYQHHTFTLNAFKTSQLIKYPKLTELYFNPTQHIYLDPKTFTKLCQGLRTLKSLNVLYLNFSYTTILNDRKLDELILALRQLHGLTVLSLNFRQNPHITGEGIAKLLKTVKKKRFLSKLYLNFSGCSPPSDFHFESIYSSISKMKLLTSLHMNNLHVPFRFRHGKLADILIQLRRLNYMQDFSISMDFQLYNGIEGDDLIALSKSLRRMVRLSKLSLESIGNLNFDKKSLQSLVHSLQSLPKLQKLHLHFGNNVNKFCFSIISQAFENCPALSNLILDFSHHTLPSKIAALSLLISLPNLTNLSKLDVDFSHSRCIDNFVLLVLCKNINNLSSLKLNLSKCCKVNGEGLDYITNALKNHPSLKDLQLSLTHQPLKSAFLPFSEALGHLPHLSKLVLNFGFSRDLGNQEIQGLAVSLQKLKNLQYFDLNLRCALEISDEGLHDLSSQIGDLQSLQVLSLNFYGCQKITSEGHQFLKSQLAQLKSLKRIYLNKFKKEPHVSLTPLQSPEQKSPKKSTCSLF